MFRIYLIAAMAFGAVATPAISQPTEITVKLADSDLDTRAGRAQLRKRVASAVEQLCGSYAAAESYQWEAIDHCRKQALESSNRQIAALRKARSIRMGAR